VVLINNAWCNLCAKQIIFKIFVTRQMGKDFLIMGKDFLIGPHHATRCAAAGALRTLRTLEKQLRSGGDVSAGISHGGF
jgi:hypothetical protein